MAFARWLGMQVPNRLDAMTIADQVVQVLPNLRATLVIVDEVHTLKTYQSAGAEAASTL